MLFQDFTLKQLENSPRHHEWTEISNASKAIHSYLVFPEISNKATSIVIIPENRGLTCWVRSFAEQLVAEGFLLIIKIIYSNNSIYIPKFECSPKTCFW